MFALVGTRLSNYFLNLLITKIYYVLLLLNTFQIVIFCLLLRILVKKLLQILQCFNGATNFFSHVYKPTSHEFLEQTLNIAGAFNEGKKLKKFKILSFK